MEKSRSMYEYLIDKIGGKNDICKMIYFGRKISARELRKTIASVAGFLKRAGVQKGDVVAIALPNVPEAIFAFYAVNAIGAVANLIHPKLSDKAFCNLVKKTKTKVLFLYDKLYKKRRQSLAGVTTVVCAVSEYMPHPLKTLFRFTEPLYAAGAIKFCDILKEPADEMTPCGGSEPAIYIHSGGTTGDPKTVVLSSDAFNRLANSLIDTVYVKGEPLKEEDVMLMMLPIFHGFGLGVCVHTALSYAQTALLPRFTSSLANKMIKKYGVTHLAGVPAMFAKMRREKNFAGPHLKEIKRIFCGGDRLDPKVKKEFDYVLKSFGSDAELTEGYGLSEVSAVFSVSLTGETRAGCQGRPLKGNAVKVLDDNGKELPRGEIGELYVSSPSMMLYYLEDPRTTEAVISKDDKGKRWLKTGDMGYVDQDGAIYFKERSKRSIKIAGINIFPSEIEQVVSTLAEIRDCCVIRAEQNGKPCTKLLIVLNEKARLDTALEKRIKSVIYDSLMKYAVPKEIYEVDQLARTSFGKVDFMLYEKQGGPL